MRRLILKGLIPCLIIGLIPSVTINAEENSNLVKKFSGRILLQVESNGEAWYVNPADLKRCFLGRPEDAFKIMRELALGISDRDLDKLPIAGEDDGGVDKTLLNRLIGRIVLQVEDKGQAYYIDPVSKEAIYLGRPADAFQIMRGKGLGITNDNLEKVNANPRYSVNIISGNNNTVSNNSNNTTIINNNNSVINNFGNNNSNQTTNENSQNITPAPPANNSNETENSVSFAHLTDLESPADINPGDQEKVLLAFKIKSANLIKLSSLKISHQGSGSHGEINNLGLYEYSTGVLLGSKTILDGSGNASFNKLNKSFKGEESFLIKGSVSANAIGNKTHILKILSSSQIEIEPVLDMTGLPVESRQFNSKSNISVSIARTFASPSGNVYDGSSAVLLAEFNITAQGEDIKVKRLSVVLDRSGIENGGSSASVIKGKILVDGSQVGQTLEIKEGSASTSWSDGTLFEFGSVFVIPSGKTKKLAVYSDISSSGTPFQNGDTTRAILIAGTENAEGVSSGSKIHTNFAEGNILTVKKNTISAEKFAGFAGCVSASNCQNRNAGAADVKIASFVIRAETAEVSNLHEIRFKPLLYAADYGNLTIKTSSGSTVCSLAPSSANDFVCTPSTFSLSNEMVFDVFSSQLSTSPESAGLDPYTGLIIKWSTGIGRNSGVSFSTDQETELQKLYIAL